MDFDDDESSAPIAKSKFQPKAKLKARAPQIKKVTSAAKPAVTPQAAEHQLVGSPTKVKVIENDISDGADATTVGVQSKISTKETKNLQTLSGADPLFFSMENLNTISFEYVEEHGNIQESENQPFLSGDSVIENTEGFAGLDSVDDIIPQSNTLAGVSFDAFDSHNEEDTSNGSLSLPFPFLEMENIELETQGEEDFTSYDFMSEVDVSSVKRASKFLPKVKQNHGETTMGNDSASDPKEPLVDPSETKILNEGFVNGGSPFARVDDDFPTNPHDECLLNQVEFLEASSEFMSDLPSCTDATPDCPLNLMEELPQSDFGVIHDDSSQQFTSFSEDMHSEPLPIVPEVENNNGHNEEKAGSKKRKPSSRSKKDKDANGNDKPIRKRKKATEASEKSIDASKKSSEQPPKKFSRSTRRRNRSVNRSLLEIPEDEIDPLCLPVRDLLMLAEHRERQSSQNKETDTRQTVMPVKETAAPVVEPVERTNEWVHDYCEDYEAQAEGSFDNPSTSTVAHDTTNYNYHSHMARTPRIKWSKEDTQLFYEGLRQFGSDLSMIQHLFPGRTRQQIKLKYKKEERQQPMQLLDALANRSKDLSHYKLVIGKLQVQIDREEEQRRAEEEALGGSAAENEGSQEEGAAEDIQEPKQDEGAKTEQNTDGYTAVKDANEDKIGSPTASKDSDVDMYDDWSFKI